MLENLVNQVTGKGEGRGPRQEVSGSIWNGQCQSLWPAYGQPWWSVCTAPLGSTEPAGSSQVCRLSSPQLAEKGLLKAQGHSLKESQQLHIMSGGWSRGRLCKVSNAPEILEKNCIVIQGNESRRERDVMRCKHPEFSTWPRVSAPEARWTGFPFQPPTQARQRHWWAPAPPWALG